MGLSFFDEAKTCYESLRTLGEGALADTYLKKLQDAQETVENDLQKNHDIILGRNYNSEFEFWTWSKVPKTSSSVMPKTESQ